MSNVTIIMEFLLLGFSMNRQHQILHFVVILALYLIILMGNFLIITLVAFNTNLHSPMYFFHANLSIVDLGSTSVIIPKSMTNSILNITLISYSGCIAQLLFFIFFMSSDLFLLTVMAYDRYVAICLPLHYASVMNWGTCNQLAAGAWMAGFLVAVVHTGAIFTMPFCSNIIDQFFCEIPQLIKISCFASFLSESWALIITECLAFLCFVSIVMSYVRIFSSVLRMPSMESRQKTFSTCIPQIIVVALLVINATFSYLIPTSSSTYNLHQVLAVIYSVVPPMMNPVIYSMRKKDVKAAFWQLFNWRQITKNHL